MSVSIPSDLVVDVMRAADPARVQLATRKLAAASSTAVASADFTAALGQADAAAAPSGDLVLDVMRAAEPQRAQAAARKLVALAGGKPDAYGQFESFMLRDAFEAMLPKAESGAYGDGFAGGVWRSMAAEQFASIFTSHGGLGIAEMLRQRDGTSRTADHAATTTTSNHPVADGQWPYYRAPALQAFTGAA
jgi:peptidoglycan hydrolase FlgJ